MQYQFLQTRNGRVGYVKVGHGPVLIMILRYGATLYNWDRSFINLLSKRFTLYLIDPPLVGGSSGEIAPLISEYAKLICDFMNDLHLPNPILLGWSFGGALVQEIILLLPDYIRGIVFLSAFPDSRLSDSEFAQLQMGNEELSKDKKNRLFELMYSEKSTPELITRIKNSGLTIENYNYRLSPEARLFHNQLVLSWPGSTPDNLSSVKIPTLVLRSRNDLIFNFSAIEPFIKNIPNSKLIDYPKGGHLFLHYYSQEVAQDIINYFK